MTSAIATGVDYGLYLFFVYQFFNPVLSNIFSYSIAVGVNFTLQKWFIFEQKRKTTHAFLWSIAVSVGGLFLSTAIIYGLVQLSFFERYQFVTKLVATGIVFFYNFYFKRFAFEKRFI